MESNVNWAFILMVLIRLILEGMTTDKAVAKISEDFQINPDRIWSILPNSYK